MAKSPLSLSDVKRALDKANISGKWQHLWSYQVALFAAENGARIEFKERDDTIFLNGPPAARKQLVAAIWSYRPPKAPTPKQRLKNVERMLREIKQQNK